MNESTLGSSVALALVALVALLLVRALGRRIASRTLASVLAVMLLLAAASGIHFVDTNIPLIQSHFRPGGEPAPVWVALLAWGFRFAAFFVSCISSHSLVLGMLMFNRPINTGPLTFTLNMRFPRR